MTNRCLTCGRGDVCQPCAEGNPPERDDNRRRALIGHARRYLTEIPGLYELLPLLIEPGGSTNQGRRLGPRGKPTTNLVVLDLLDGREKPDSQPQRTDYDQDRRQWVWRDRYDRPVTENAARRQGVLPTLVSWCRLIDGEARDAGEMWPEYGLASCGANCEEAMIHARSDEREGPCSAITRRHWTRPTIAGECGFVAEHLDWCSDRQWFSELVRDLRTMRADMRDALRERDPEPYTCAKCGWEMQGMGDYDPERGRHPWYRCTGCSAAISTASELARASKAAEDAVPLKYAADQLGQPWSTLRRWKREGWISPLGRDQRGEVYSLAAIKQAIARNAARQTARV